MITLNVVGCGRVGQTLARLFHDHGTCRIQDVKARTVARARDAVGFIGEGRAVAAIGEMRPADVWMLTVPDNQIAHAAAEVADAYSMRAQSSIAFHCSGFHPASALAPLPTLGWHLASAHPALTFATPPAALTQFPGTPCGLEGDELALRTLRPLFAAIGGQCFDLASERKALYHAAAVFASNFTVVVQMIAREAWAASGVPDDIARKMQASLACATIDNVMNLGAQAITGPAARGDTHVVEREEDAVSRWHPQAGLVYKELSVLARHLAERRSTRAA
jgi:predicted short-subunit dehydrogenase-like oxidoreductase (DUF2520 family)